MCIFPAQNSAQEGATAQMLFWAVPATVPGTVDDYLHQQATVGIIRITWLGAHCLKAATAQGQSTAYRLP